jgi:hypothetical protein
MARRLGLLLCIGATIAAATAGLAQALHAPGDPIAKQRPGQYSSAQLNQQDMLGPKYVTFRTRHR